MTTFNEQAISLYKSRLQSFSQTITDLHTLVKNDQIIHTLKDPQMEKYRIDRINQIVSEILNSQKQKMIIRVLEKYQEVCEKLKLKQKEKQDQDNKYMKNSNVKEVKGKKDTNYVNNLQSIKQKLQQENQKLFSINQQKNEMLKDKTQQIEKLKQKIKQKQKQLLLANLITNINAPQSKCQKCQKYMKRIQQIQKQNRINQQFIQKLKKDGQSALKHQTQKLTLSTQKNNFLQTELQKTQKQLKTLQHSHTFKQKQLQKQQENNMKVQLSKRNQKIQVMRRQIAFLEEQLIQVQKNFNSVKDLAIGGALSEIRKIKVCFKKFKEYCKESLANLEEENRNNVEKIVNKVNKTLSNNGDGLKPDRLMTKINQLDNQLDYFLENQVLVD